MPFEFKPLEIPGLVLIETKVFHDDRGYFFEHYKQSEFAANGIDCQFLQDNYSASRQNVVRGLHYQLSPMAQGKLVRVVKGVAWDVAVDIRKNSPHYMKWVGVELSEDNRSMLYLPPGFAHGFAALSHDVRLMYKCTSEYSHPHERGICWDDPQIAIKWPVNEPIVSQRDASLPLLENAEVFE